MDPKVVPQAPENLLLENATYVGIPVKRYAGREINPPPPAAESKNLPRKTMLHRKTNIGHDRSK